MAVFDMVMHMSAHIRQVFAQSIIIVSPLAMVSQAVAHALHIFAQRAHISMHIVDWRIMKSAHIWHI